MREDLRDLPRFPPAVAAIVLGALWGGLAYAVLWGHTPLLVSRRFVVSALGTLVLLPVRLVLWGIRSLEGAVGEIFAFADANWWIGVVAAAVGAAISVGALLGARSFTKRLRNSS